MHDATRCVRENDLACQREVDRFFKQLDGWLSPSGLQVLYNEWPDEFWKLVRIARDLPRQLTSAARMIRRVHGFSASHHFLPKTGCANERNAQ